MNEFLQIVLLVNVFLIGVVLTLGYKHWVDPKIAGKHSANDIVIPHETKQQLVQLAQKKFETTLDNSAILLHEDMAQTSKQLSSLLEKFGTGILDDEMKMFRTNLEEIRKKTEAETGNTHKEIANHQNQLEVDLAKRRADLEKQINEHQDNLELSINDLQSKIALELQSKQQGLLDSLLSRQAALQAAMENQVAKDQALLIKQIDTKIGDALGSFLLEALGNNVDLGAQKPYLLKLLDEHKDEIKNEVSNGNKANTAS